jgi:uncharacterized protein
VMFDRWLKAGAVAGLAVLLMAAAPGGVLEGLPFAKKMKLAKVGDDEAQYAVGFSFETGVDVKADRTEAAVWYRKAARQGHLDAMFRLARIVQEGADGLKKSPETAFKLYEAAAKKDHAEAQNWLGYCYQHGIGVTASPRDAVAWYGKSADAGLAVAQNNLGLMYLNGQGVERNFGEAFKLFERASLQGDGWGLNNLGGLYEMGWGVAKDRAKALDHYKRAKGLGIDSAADNIKRLTAAVDPATAEKPPVVEKIERPAVDRVVEPAAEPSAETKKAVAEPEPTPDKAVIEPAKPKAETAKTDGSEGTEAIIPAAEDPDVAETASSVKTDSSPE